MTAIIIFYGSNTELNKVQKLVLDGINDSISDISTGTEFDVDGSDALYYTVDFIQDGWLNIIELQEDLSKQNCEIDIIHVLYDETSIEVLSTDSKYDEYEDLNSPQRMQTLAGLYGINIKTDDEPDELDEPDEFDYSDFDDE
jgi:hypothetical protein